MRDRARRRAAQRVESLLIKSEDDDALALWKQAMRAKTANEIDKNAPGLQEVGRPKNSGNNKNATRVSAVDRQRQKLFLTLKQLETILAR